MSLKNNIGVLLFPEPVSVKNQNQCPISPEYPIRNLSFDSGHSDIKKAMIEKMGSVLQNDKRWTCYWHTFQVDKCKTADVLNK